MIVVPLVAVILALALRQT